MASYPINHMSNCPIGRLSGWPGWRGWPDWPDCPVICHFLATSWPGWPVTRSPVVPLAVGQLSVLDTYFPPKLPRWYSLEHFYFWKWKRVLRRGNKRQNDILNNNISVFGTYFPAKLPKCYPLEHFFFRKWKRVLRRDRWYALEHFCFSYLFSTETSEMIPTGTLLFLKMTAGSKKRRIIRHIFKLHIDDNVSTNICTRNDRDFL